MSKENEEIGKRIKNLREKKNWSQVLTSEKLKIDNSILSKIESGKRDLEAPLLHKMADLFEVSADEILGRKTKDKEKSNLFFFDIEGLNDEEIEDIQRHINYVKWKSEQEKKK
jgi:transcriptional regulator with XRE-family HTH domain